MLMLGLAVVQWHSLRPRAGVGAPAAEGTAPLGRRRGGGAARGAAGPSEAAPLEAGPIERDEARGLLAMVGPNPSRTLNPTRTRTRIRIRILTLTLALARARARARAVTLYPKPSGQVGLCMLSGFAGALMERLLKDRSRSASLWMRNLQLALFSLPLAAALVPLADAEALRTHGPLVGLNRWAAAVVVLGAR